MLNSPSTPPSSTSTRPPATVDGSIRPIEDTRPLRSVEAIRADLKHPHTAALTALHSTTIGDGPIGRLLRDVEPLVAEVERLTEDAAMAWRETRRNIEENQRLSALVDEQLGECIGCNYDDGPDECCPQHGRTVTEWIDIASTVIGRQHAIEAERDAALARIAAVEALPAAGASVRRKSLDETVNGVDPMSFEYGWLRAIEHVRAALAASPTPTGPDGLVECQMLPNASCAHEGCRSLRFGRALPQNEPGPAIPEPTEETPNPCDSPLVTRECQEACGPCWDVGGCAMHNEARRADR